MRGGGEISRTNPDSRLWWPWGVRARRPTASKTTGYWFFPGSFYIGGRHVRPRRPARTLPPPEDLLMIKGRSLLPFTALIFGLSCDGPQQATGIRGVPDASEIIADGAHGGNPDFFFLPPMVPPPFQHPDFEPGKVTPRLQLSLNSALTNPAREPADLNLPATRPKTTTACAATPLVEEFLPGSVDLVGMPSQQTGWWSNFNLPADGFYKALWDTRQENLSLDKYYRIKVLIDGSDEPLGYADVDPVSNMREWKHVMTGEVVTMIDDTKLPIAFRVETGALCGEATQCGSATITNDNPNGDTQVLQVLTEGGIPVAGVLIPDNWLPPDGPQSVVISIERVNTGVKNVPAGTQQFPCHANLPLQQFDGCFNFRTIPELAVIDEETGRQFATPIIAAVCFVLSDTEDPREPYVQLWSSEPDEEGDQPEALPSADASLVLTNHDGRNCAEQAVVAASSNPLIRVASAGWRKFAKGFDKAFGVKTAYAVDLGIGGILDSFSNVGPAMSAEIQGYTSTEFTLGGGATTTSTARVVGTQKHDGSSLNTGIGGVAVTYTVAAGHGTLNALGTTGGAATEITVTTNTNPINPESPTSGGGFAPVNWTLPTTPGTYTLTATANARGGPVTFTATVPEPVSLNVLSGPWVNEDIESTTGIVSLNMGPSDGAFVVQSWGNCSPWDCDWGVTNATTTGWATGQQITAFWDQEYATRTQTITYLSASRIQVVTVTDFSEADGRTDYTLTEFFERPALGLLARGWVNPATTGANIARVNIISDVEGTQLHAFGNCSPTACDWGPTNSNTTGWNSSYSIVGSWDQGFAVQTMTVQFMSLDDVWVTTHTNFTEADGRTDFTTQEYFRLDT